MSKNPAAAKRGIPSKSDFKDWYPFIVEAAELVDKRYPIKGMDVWRPYGWKTMRLIDDITHTEMERTDHDEVNFPLLIPEDLLEKENRLVSLLKTAREKGVDPSELRMDEESKGFAKEVYWIRHAGETELDVPMFLRPTSETAMYTMFPLWIRSHADLPLKTYQIVNTFRYETKQTRSFIRVREIHFFEAHTAHVDEADATRQIEEDLGIVENLMNKLNLPVLVTKRPVWDTFPGAWYTIAIDVIMPDGRTLQVASCHHYRDQWARAFDVKYEDESGNQQYVHQTTYGMSERLLGAIVANHGDDKGLQLPPKIAPYQVVMVPIFRDDDDKKNIKDYVIEILFKMKKKGVRIHEDWRKGSPGFKFNEWEMKGVPLRIEVGPKDIKDEQFVIVRRDNSEKKFVSKELIIETVLSLLDDIQNNMFNKAKSFQTENTYTVSTYEEFKDILSNKGGFIKCGWDGTSETEAAIKKETKATIRVIPIDENPKGLNCIYSGRAAKHEVIFAKAY